MTNRPSPPATPSEFLRAALARTVRHGGRELRLGAEAVAVDGLGRPLTLRRDGTPVSPDLPTLREHLSRWGHFPDERHRDDEVEFEGLGAWTVRIAADGTIALRSKRPPAACLEALFEAPPAELAMLRGLYRHGGVDVRVACEGETRARDVALALTAERRMLGLPTRTVIGPTRDQRYASRPIPVHDGPETFDEPVGEGPGWLVEAPTGDRPDRRPEPTAVGPGTRVHVTSDTRGYGHLRGGDPLAGHAAPAAVVVVALVDSKPVARVFLSPSARALAASSEPFPGSPWEAHAERRAARLRARPPKPRTWHQTTSAVAEAFVARQAPRGLVSGYPIYFHGPVAYSLSDANPIAAFVATRDGAPLLLTGRSLDIGGTKAGTITSAQGDVHAAGRGLRMIDVGDLAPLLRVAGLDLRAIPLRHGRDKTEDGLPREAEILPEALSAWITDGKSKGEAEVDKAFATRFPTQRQANAYRGLAHLAGVRDTLARALGLDLPEVGDKTDLDRLAKRAQDAADRRQLDLSARERLRREADAPAGPLP